MPVSPGRGWDPETSATELHLVGTQHSAPTEMSGDRSGTIILFSVRALGLRAQPSTVMTRANLLWHEVTAPILGPEYSGCC